MSDVDKLLQEAAETIGDLTKQNETLAEENAFLWRTLSRLRLCTILDGSGQIPTEQQFIDSIHQMSCKKCPQLRLSADEIGKKLFVSLK